MTYVMNYAEKLTLFLIWIIILMDFVYLYQSVSYKGKSALLYISSTMTLKPEFIFL